VLWANQHFADFFGIADLNSVLGVNGLLPQLGQNMQQCFAKPEDYFASIKQTTQDLNYIGSEEIGIIHPVPRTLQCFTTPVHEAQGEYIGRLWVYRDITEQRQLEEQLYQTQKIESIGQLAGGIAHDFNNLLTPIMGYVDLGAAALPADHPTRGCLEEIGKAAERAANLTRQLLAFSRRQIIEPKVFNINDLILDMENMLRRLISEDIELATIPDPNLGLVKVDRGQFEQVLVNLVVNARDAMPNGGSLTVTTANVTLDDRYASGHPDVVPGEYVVLEVSDSGVGMTEEVKSHIFEPFFTTKELGKGTGLGLATCYGIVKQNNGHISVRSKLNQGTTFEVYFRITEELVSAEEVEGVYDQPPFGDETVLLVEDEDAVRVLMARILNDFGYTVVTASGGQEALNIASQHTGQEIHLLLSDVVMPQMSGVELADRLRMVRPQTKVLYMSGYTDDAIIHHGVLEPGVEFMGKPFSPPMLARKVREVLERSV